MHTDLPEDHLGPDLPTPLRVQAVEPADLVSYIQHTLGFAPRDSVTAIGLSGNGLGAVLRCDWSPEHLTHWRTTSGFARQFATHLAADERADGCLVLLFRDGTVREGLLHDGTEWAGPAPMDPTGDGDRLLAAALERELADAGIPVQETWLVCDGGLWHLDCPDLPTCTAHGSSVGRTRTSALNAAFILEGSVVEDEPRDSVLPAPAAEMSPELMGAVEDFWNPVGAVERFAQWLWDWEDILRGADLPADPAARAMLLGGLEQVNLRDTLVAAASFTLERAVSGGLWLGALPAALGESTGVEPREVNAVLYSSVLMATSRRAPDWDRIARLRSACAGLLPEAAGTPASAARCLAAWVEWARGRGSAAGRLIAECRLDDPDYSLGEVLAQIVDQGILSGWAGRRATAWSARGRRTA